VRIKSRPPIYSPTAREEAITIPVIRVASCLDGQETLASSSLTSLKYLSIFCMFTIVHYVVLN